MDELRISRAVVDELTGLPTGLTGKLFGPSRVKKIGMDSLWLLPPALGVRLALEEDHGAAARVSSRWERRHERHRRVGVVRRQITPEMISAVAREMGRRSAQSRRAARAVAETAGAA